jgi:predicted SAM-dependent methyltransferase
MPVRIGAFFGGLRARLGLSGEQLEVAQRGRILTQQETEILARSRPIAERTCPICGYEGWFGVAGSPARPDAHCPQCHSLERHRQFWLWLERHGPLPVPVLHFAPETVLRERLSKAYGSGYVTADLFEPDMDLVLDLESIALPDASQGTILASHVLEHVDDAKALAELWRILQPGGLLIMGTPVIETWATTYENPEVQSAEERVLHFGQDDHVRYYGRDVRDRVLTAGFEAVEEVVATPEECRRFGLIRGETLFIYRRPRSA